MSFRAAASSDSLTRPLMVDLNFSRSKNALPVTYLIARSPMSIFATDAFTAFICSSVFLRTLSVAVFSLLAMLRHLSASSFARNVA